MDLLPLVAQFHTLTARSLCYTLFQLFFRRIIPRLLLVNIIGTDARNGIRLVAVQVNQALEANFLTAVKQPVDGALLVNFAVVGVEIVQEVVADDLFRLPLAAQCVCMNLKQALKE